MSALQLQPAGPLPGRKYVLLISGTMNPPHVGHVSLGLHAARELRGKGHIVSAICFAPVHDNYLHNKVSLKGPGALCDHIHMSPDTICFPMSERCDILRSLVQLEPSSDKDICHVLDYEHEHGAHLLEESPGYWAPRLPDGYLKTVPTVGLMGHFAANSSLLSDGDTRLGIVFGVDNLAGIVTWNRPSELLARADLVFVSRAMASVSLPRDPSELVKGLKHFELLASVPVIYKEVTLFGDQTGSFGNKDALGEGALFLLPALKEGGEQLSSTNIRTSVAACASTLAQHGFAGLLAGRLFGSMGTEVLTKIRKAGDERQEFVKRARTSE